MQIRVEDLSMIYNPGLPYETRALDHISVEIKPGEFVAIIGHTGSGKTTLVQQIAGLLEPTSGRVVAVAEDGTETVISEKGKASFAVRRKVGIVFQYPEYQLFEETVLKDVCFGPKNQGLSEEEQIERAKTALKLVGMDADEIGGESPFELSGGQKRRVAIAGVLAMDPEVLILDEPTAGLDPKGHDDILRMIDRIQDDRNITIILVSHNMDDVAEYADTVLVMNKGSLFMQGDPRYVYCERGRELKSVGLDLPAGPGFLEDLQDLGLDVDIEKLTFDETAEEIIRVVKKKWQ
ncbi:MAG: energy-coupling factor transporter ATPase [Firmicutes bacterium]|nr:energy-coupling factor transporter ATPase [Bacillota bacterium]MBQ5414935.1 energy-coupling factor transporter ATPase [Bacillota bacterium]